MMLQRKHKYFNNKIKILLLILMWTLIWQHVYGKSSTYDELTVVAAPAAAYNSDDGDGDDDANGIGDKIQESAAKKQITTTTTITSTTTTTSTSTTENEGNNNNNATIYDHINENDNNSNKLPQNVAKRDHHQQQQQQRQPKMMKIGMPPPTEQVLMAKDQLNKTEDKVPQDKDDYDYENTQEESKALKMSMAKVNNIITGAISSNNSNIHQSNDERSHFNINDRTADSNHDETTASAYSRRTLNDDDGTGSFKPEDQIYVSSNINTSDEIAQHKAKAATLALLQQQIIHQFAMKYKHIPRVTYFTCRQPSSISMVDNNVNTNASTGRVNIFKHQTNMPVHMAEFLRRMYPSGVTNVATPSKGTNTSVKKSRKPVKNTNDLMLRIVQIDHLISKRRPNMNSVGYGTHPRLGAGAFGVGAQTSRNTFTNTNWLEQILCSEPLRQIVVLDLSCGASSRRLLEMASNKALFNSMYHWLLMEDYVFNRQTEIDDANDIKNKLSKKSASSASRRSSKAEVVNDSISILQVKQLSTYTTDVIGASASGSGKQYKSPSTSFSATTDNRQLQRSVNDSSAASSNGDSVGAANEDDMEIIEKFLEKLNININTELILAKRRMRGTSSSSSLSAPIPSIMKPSLTNFASLESNDYNTLQKMDYYMLYDVWSPGTQYGGKLNVSEIGNFSLNLGFKIANWYRNASTVTRRMNMNLAKIRCLVVVTHKNLSHSLEEYLTTDYDTHLDSMNRFNFALLSHVRDLFNFSFILSKTSTWGYLKNGKFDGMIGALVRKQADIGGSPIFFRIERAKVIDYTARTWVARPCFIFRHPRSTKKDRIVFLQPFSNDVWIFSAICGCITIFLLWILTSLESKFKPSKEEEVELQAVASAAQKVPNNMRASQRALIADNCRVKQEPKHPGILKGTGFKRRFVRWGGIFCGQEAVGNNKSKQNRVGLFVESLLFYIGSICQQGLAFSTRFFSGRCIVITSLLFSFSIYQFYSASIVGTLLMEKPKTIRTLRDLIHSSLEIGVEDIVYNRDYFLRTKDPDAQELYAKKVTSVPMTGDTGFVDVPLDNFALPPPTHVTSVLTDAQKAKAYRDILHSHETGAHAKTNAASNWYDPEFGVAKIKKGRFAFHVDVATAYKIIADTFKEKEICDLTEIQLFPPQKMVNIVQKGSPLRKMITFGLRRVTEVGLTDYERKVWHSPKPRCIKQLHTDDLRVDMQTFTSALLVLIFGYAVSLLILGLEIMHYKLWQRYATTTS